MSGSGRMEHMCRASPAAQPVRDPATPCRLGRGWRGQHNTEGRTLAALIPARAEEVGGERGCVGVVLHTDAPSLFLLHRLRDAHLRPATRESAGVGAKSQRVGNTQNTEQAMG